MNVFTFELKKLWRRKKILWLFIINLLIVLAIFLPNYFEQERMPELALEEIQPYEEEVNVLEQTLRAKENYNEINDSESNQLAHVEGMGLTFFQWKSAIYNEEWDKIPIYEQDFLTNLQQFEHDGGEFGALQGMEREITIEKNQWLLKNNIPYENEKMALSPHLLLKENTTTLFSILGLLLLVLLFGNSVTIEKESHTWFTLNTQPIPKWKLIISKFISLLFVVVVFQVVVIGLSIIIPLLFGDHSLRLMYPQMVFAGEEFAVISTWEYVLRGSLLFICASAFTFSLVLFVSKWMKNTFSTLIVVSLIMMVGYLLTTVFTALQSAWNPFYLSYFHSIMDEMLGKMDWLYPSSALLWSGLFVWLAAFAPEKEVGLSLAKEYAKPFSDRMPKWKSKFFKITLLEWRKTKRKGLFKQAIIFMLLLVIVGYVYIFQEVEQKKTVYMDKLHETVQRLEEETIPVLEEMKESYEDMIVQDESYAVYAKDIDEFLKTQQERFRLANNAIKGYEERDWIPFYEYQLFENRLYNGEFNTEPGISLAQYVGSFTMDASIEEKYWLLKRNIQPIFSGEYIKTIYLNWEEQQDFGREWEAENERIDTSGLYTLYYYFNRYAYMLLILVLFFLLGGGIAAERGKKATLQFLRTQPISLKHIFIGKVIHTISVTFISSIGIFLFVVLVGTLFDRFGDWDYPILHYDQRATVQSSDYTGSKPVGMTTGFHFKPLGEVLLQNVMLFLFALVFVMVLSLFFGNLFRNQLSVFAITSIILIGGYVLSIEFLSDIAHWLPFTYFDISRITNGELAVILDNPYINVLSGSMVLLVSSIVILLIGYLSAAIKKIDSK